MRLLAIILAALAVVPAAQAQWADTNGTGPLPRPTVRARVAPPTLAPPPVTVTAVTAQAAEDIQQSEVAPPSEEPTDRTQTVTLSIPKADSVPETVQPVVPVAVCDVQCLLDQAYAAGQAAAPAVERPPVPSPPSELGRPPVPHPCGFATPAWCPGGAYAPAVTP